MSIARPVAAVACCAAAALLLAAAASAVAAPRAVPATSKKITLVRQIAKLDGQHTSLRKRVRTCPAAAADLRVATRQRAGAMRRATVRRPLRVLRAKRAVMAASVLRLSRAARRCATGAAPPATVQAVPAAPTGTAPVTLPTLMGGVAVDLKGLLDGLALPEVLRLVHIDQLSGVLCSTAGVACVGIDLDLLGSAVRRLVATNLVGSLLSLDLSGVLSSVQALLNVGDLASLVRLERVGDTALRLVPIGPLAGLAGLPVVPNLPIGAIRVVP